MCDRSSESFMYSFVPDREDRRGRASRRFDVEHFVEVALVELACDAVDLWYQTRIGE